MPPLEVPMAMPVPATYGEVEQSQLRVLVPGSPRHRQPDLTELCIVPSRFVSAARGFSTSIRLTVFGTLSCL